MDVYIDFKKGSTFSYEYVKYKTETEKETIDGEEKEVESKIEITRENFNNLKSYDTTKKT